MLFLQRRVKDVRTLLFPLWNCLFWNDHGSQKLISTPFDIKDIFFGMVSAVNNNDTLLTVTVLNSINPSSPLVCFSKNVREHIKLTVLLQERTKSYFSTTKNESPFHFSNNSYHFLSISKHVKKKSLINKYIQCCAKVLRANFDEYRQKPAIFWRKWKFFEVSKKFGSTIVLTWSIFRLIVRNIARNFERYFFGGNECFEILFVCNKAEVKFRSFPAMLWVNICSHVLMATTIKGRVRMATVICIYYKRLCALITLQ